MTTFTERPVGGNSELDRGNIESPRVATATSAGQASEVLHLLCSGGARRACFASVDSLLIF